MKDGGKQFAAVGFCPFSRTTANANWRMKGYICVNVVWEAGIISFYFIGTTSLFTIKHNNHYLDIAKATSILLQIEGVKRKFRMQNPKVLLVGCKGDDVSKFDPISVQVGKQQWSPCHTSIKAWTPNTLKLAVRSVQLNSSKSPDTDAQNFRNNNIICSFLVFYKKKRQFQIRTVSKADAYLQRQVRACIKPTPRSNTVTYTGCEQRVCSCHLFGKGRWKVRREVAALQSWASEGGTLAPWILKLDHFWPPLDKSFCGCPWKKSFRIFSKKELFS